MKKWVEIDNSGTKPENRYYIAKKLLQTGEQTTASWSNAASSTRKAQDTYQDQKTNYKVYDKVYYKASTNCLKKKTLQF